MTTKHKARTSITIDPDLLEQVRQYVADAGDKGVSFSSVVSAALSAYLSLPDPRAAVKDDRQLELPETQTKSIDELVEEMNRRESDE